MQTSTNTCSILSFGRGPDELLVFGTLGQYGSYPDGAKVWIQSFPFYMGELNLTKSLRAGKTVYDRKYVFIDRPGPNHMFQSNQMFILDSNRFLLPKDPSRMRERNDNGPYYAILKYDTNTITDSVFMATLPGIKKGNELIYAGYHGLKPDRKKIARVFRFMNMLTIYDLTNFSCRTISFDPSAGNYQRAQEQKIEHNTALFATDQLIYVIHNPTNSNQALGQTLAVFDWSGTLIGQYALNDELRYLFVDELHKMMYAITDSELLVKYDLSPIYASSHDKLVSTDLE